MFSGDVEKPTTSIAPYIPRPVSGAHFTDQDQDQDKELKAARRIESWPDSYSESRLFHNLAVSSVCRDRAEGLCQFGLRSRPARRPSG
jgi:hypothetical protein